jgi:sulfiredoxin
MACRPGDGLRGFVGRSEFVKGGSVESRSVGGVDRTGPKSTSRDRALEPFRGPPTAIDWADQIEVRMLKAMVFQIKMIRVPVKRAKTLDADKVGRIAESILQNGQTTPIQVRADGDRFVLVEGLHRLEAMKALGEKDIAGYLVQARKH